MKMHQVELYMISDAILPRKSLVTYSGECNLWRIADDITQDSHRLEMYLNIQDCLEESLKIKFVLKITWKTIKGLEKTLNFNIYRRIQHCLWRPKSV